MKYAIEMVSGAMIYIPHFIKTGSAIQKLIWGDSQRHSMLILKDYLWFMGYMQKST
jgi:hypothetical protein